jgi:hypothetical protein
MHQLTRGGAWSPSSTRSVSSATSTPASLGRWTGKRVEPWPYVPYDVVPHPGAYDKKAPLSASSTEVAYTTTVPSLTTTTLM